MATMAGPTGWQIELDAFRNGGGSYWVPDPQPGMTLADLQAGQKKATDTAAGIEARYGEFKNESNLGPMAELVGLLETKAYAYEVAIAQLQQGNGNAETPQPATGAGNNKTILYGGLGALALLYFMKKKKAMGAARKKEDEKALWWIAGGGLLLWLIMRKKQEVVQVDPQPQPQPQTDPGPGVDTPIKVPISDVPIQVTPGPELYVPIYGGGGGGGYYPEGTGKGSIDELSQYQ